MKTPVLPPIPAKRYFTIGEVADLCAVKPHVLRYWEQEFTQLNPMKRRGNRRYYQHHEVLMVRRIRDLLYEQGFTISGARSQLESSKNRPAQTAEPESPVAAQTQTPVAAPVDTSWPSAVDKKGITVDWRLIRQELEALRNFLS